MSATPMLQLQDDDGTDARLRIEPYSGNGNELTVRITMRDENDDSNGLEVVTNLAELRAGLLGLATVVRDITFAGPQEPELAP